MSVREAWRSLVAGGTDAARIGGALALGVAMLFLLTGRDIDLLGSTARIFLVLVWPLALVATWATGRALPAWVYLIGVGLLLRIADFPAGGGGPSDVQAATHEAIAVLLRGENPYTHVYEQTRPPGSSMPYPPGALLVHLPGYLLQGMIGVQGTQVALAAATMAAFAWLGARVSWVVALPALAAYAAAPNLVILSLDGSSDTGVGAGIVLALLALMIAIERGPTGRRMLLAGLLAGLVMGMKQIALPIFLIVGFFLWRRYGRRAATEYAGAAGGFLLLISVPFLVADPVAYMTRLLSFLGAHEDVYGWNIWSFARGMGWQVWERGPALVITVVSGALAFIAALVVLIANPRGLTRAVTAGLVVTLVLLLTSRWTTYAYFAMIVPIALLLPSLAAWEARRPPPALDVSRAQHQPNSGTNERVRPEDDG